MDQFLFGDELDQGKDTDQQEAEDDDGGSIAFVEFLERLPVEYRHQRRRVPVCGVGPGRHQQVYGIKLFQGGHRPHQDHKEQRRGDHGDRDMEELCCRTGAVDLSSLIIRDNEFFPIIKVMCL